MTERPEREPENNKKPRMVSIPGRLEYPEDLSPGKTKKGGLHQNLYDSQGRLTGHGDFIPDAENEEDPLTDNECRPASPTTERDEFTEAISALLAQIVADVAVALAPHVKRWWADQALPAIKTRWNKAPRRNMPAGTRETGSRPATAEASTAIEATVADSSQEMVAALDGYRASMRRTEAQLRLLLALRAKEFSEEQVRIVSNADIEDDGGFVELKFAVDELTPQQMANMIKVFEVNPSLLGNEKLAEIGKTLGRNEKINETVRLTDSEHQPHSFGEH